MRFISKSVVAGVATMSVVALGGSSASATITPSSGAVAATNTGAVVLESATITNNCTTVHFSGAVNMNNPTTQGGGAIITAMTTGGCSPFAQTGSFATPWTLNFNIEVSAGTWTGTITNVNVNLGGICTFTGSLSAEYTNSTGRMSITGGTLAGSPAALCGNDRVTGAWDVRAGAAIPQFS
jgi:hypothetical protein